MKDSLRFLCVVVILIAGIAGDEYHRKSSVKSTQDKLNFASEKETSSDYWLQKGQSFLSEVLNRQENNNHAKNVILFLGDGMSLPTVAATRVYIGAEEEELSFEKFPYSGFSKTYCVNAQVADSACTATAYLSGVKTNYEVIGLNAKLSRKNCTAQLDKENWTESIARWAQKSCKATGVVTTTRITHASPAGAYAHVGHRDWENDFEMEDSGCDSTLLDDIAEQLVYGETAKNFKVMFGGGRAGFRNQTVKDEEEHFGFRRDGKDLIEEWKTGRSKDGKAVYVFDRNGLRNLDIEKTDFVLGLFESDHMKYNLDIKNQNLKYEKPTLTEMTVAAIKILQKEENGFFLFVEGGMIDQAHHYNFAKHSLDETAEFSKAIEAARQMTSEADTLIVVTADHSHAFSYNGHQQRGSPVFGNAEIGNVDNLPFTTLSYANGPGFYKTYNIDGKRVDPSTFDFTNPHLQYPATAPIVKETHAGEDVGVWASGPMAHHFRGSYEQNAIPLIMAHILQVGPYAPNEKCSSCFIGPVLVLLAAMLVMLNLFK